MTVGPWHVDASLNRLMRGDTEVRVERKVMLLLLALARTPGRPVPRQQLLDELWGYHVSDDALHTVVAKLRRALDVDGVKSVDTVPKVGYRLMLPVSADDLTSPPAQPSVPTTGPRARVFGAMAVGLVVATLGWLWWPRSLTVEAARLTPITSERGLQVQPALAPGVGDRVVYVAQPDGTQWDLFVQGVTGGPVVQLTSTPEHEHHPAWSPDGAWIAFARFTEDTCALWLVRPTGGPARSAGACPAAEVSSVSWAASSALLVAGRSAGSPSQVFEVPLDGGPAAALTSPPSESVGDVLARLSPDGRTLAVVFSPSLGAQDLYLMPAAGGPRRRLTGDDVKIHGFDWTPDGASLVFSSNRAGQFSLWRIRSDGRGGIEQLSATGDDLDSPSVSADGHRVAYERWMTSTSVRHQSLTEPARAALAWSRWMWHVARSPNGQLALVSDRSGSPELWTMDATLVPVQRTRLGGPYVSSPRWSPDGRLIAYIVNGRARVLDVVSGAETAVTIATGAHEVRSPAWTPDGRSLLVSSNHDGGWRVWRVSLSPRSAFATPVTEAGAFNAQMDAEGRRLFYTRRGQPGIFAIALHEDDTPKAERIVDTLSPVDHGNWTLVGRSLYFVGRDGERPVLYRHDLDGATTHLIAPLPDFFTSGGLSVSADGTWTYISVDQQDADVMLWERPASRR